MSYTYGSGLTTKYGPATDQQMDKALELTRALNYHPAMNIVPVVELVQQAALMGCDLVRKTADANAVAGKAHLKFFEESEQLRAAWQDSFDRAIVQMKDKTA